MSRPTIIINELDAERIDRLLEKPEFAALPIADALNAELDRRKCARQSRCRITW
jgi:regulator of nucleoside diphosphate kinase